MGVVRDDHGNVSLRIWVASTTTSGDYATLPLLNKGQPTDMLHALWDALHACAMNPSSHNVTAARRYAYDHPDQVDTYSDADPGL